MSAFIVDRYHIDQLVSTAINGPTEAPMAFRRNRFYFFQGEDTHHVNDDTADTIGAMLWAENHRSVNHRYDETDEPESYTYTAPRQRLAIAAALKAIDCYEYQSCEHPEWEASAARTFCAMLRKRLVSCLPGYEDAPWGLTEPARVAVRS